MNTNSHLSRPLQRRGGIQDSILTPPSPKERVEYKISTHQTGDCIRLFKPPMGVWGPICVFLFLCTTAHAQQAIDTTAKKSPATEVQKPEAKKQKNKKKEAPTEAATDGKKTQDKKKGKDRAPAAVKLDSTSTRADSIKAALPKALQNAKTAKTAAAKKIPKPKPVKKVPPPPELKIIPGAEEKANAETKDKPDRTMKGPSGQRVYSSPKGGKYYFDVNGNKKFLKQDIPK